MLFRILKIDLGFNVMQAKLDCPDALLNTMIMG